VSAGRPLLAVVDDDLSIRESLPDLLRQFGYEAVAFDSAAAFLAAGVLPRTRCLLLDIAMPGTSGLELQRELAARRTGIPIVFITGQGDEALRSRMLREGAAGFLFKPFSEKALREALAAALRVQ